VLRDKPIGIRFATFRRSAATCRRSRALAFPVMQPKRRQGEEITGAPRRYPFSRFSVLRLFFPSPHPAASTRTHACTHTCPSRPEKAGKKTQASMRTKRMERRLFASLCATLVLHFVPFSFPPPFFFASLYDRDRPLHDTGRRYDFMVLSWSGTK